MAQQGGSGGAAWNGLTPVPAALPFTVDTWPALPPPPALCKPQFLTHAHKDHTNGIEDGASHIVATPDTLNLLRVKFPGLARRIDAGSVAVTPLSGGDTMHLTAPEQCGGYRYSATALDCTEHCPGAVMLLFQSDAWGSLLHTGDARLTEESVAQLHEALVDLLGGDGRPDTVWLDATYGGNPDVDFPPLAEACRAVVGMVRSHPGRVLLSAENLGTEELIAAVAAATGAPVYVPPGCSGPAGGSAQHRCGCCYQTETLHLQRNAELRLLLPPSAITDGPGAKVWAIGGRGMPLLGRSGGAHLAEPQQGAPPLIIRCSAMKTVLNHQESLEGAPAGAAAALRGAPRRVTVTREGGIHYLCWSRHSSCRELCAALQVLQPRAVVAFSGSVSELRGAAGGAHLMRPEEAEAAYAMRVQEAAAGERRRRTCLEGDGQGRQEQQQQQQQQARRLQAVEEAEGQQPKENRPQQQHKQQVGAGQGLSPRQPLQPLLGQPQQQGCSTTARKRGSPDPCSGSTAKRLAGWAVATHGSVVRSDSGAVAAASGPPGPGSASSVEPWAVVHAQTALCHRRARCVAVQQSTAGGADGSAKDASQEEGLLQLKPGATQGSLLLPFVPPTQQRGQEHGEQQTRGSHAPASLQQQEQQQQQQGDEAVMGEVPPLTAAPAISGQGMGQSTQEAGGSEKQPLASPPCSIPAGDSPSKQALPGPVSATAPDPGMFPAPLAPAAPAAITPTPPVTDAAPPDPLCSAPSAPSSDPLLARLLFVSHSSLDEDDLYF